MRAIKRKHRPTTAHNVTLALTCLASLCIALVVMFGPLEKAVHAQDKKFSVYSQQSSYSVVSVDHNGGDFVGLIDILEPLGRVDASVDGKKWTLNFTPNGASKAIEIQFSDGKAKGKVRGGNFELPGDFALINSRGYVPIAALSSLMPRVLDVTVQLHQAARRLFLGSTPFKYSSELKKNPSRLVLTFPTPVSPSIATEPGKLRMVFTKDPVVSAGADSVTYPDPLFPSMQFSERNGAAELLVNSGSPVVATFSDNGKTITIAAAPQQQAAAPPSPAPRPETPLPPPSEIPAKPRPIPSGPKFLVVIDAAHGGEERGALLNKTLSEKEVDLAFARRLLHEFENRGIPAALLRTGDNTLTLDQRAQGANLAHASVYIAVHASGMGSGMRLYTALMPASAAPPDRRQFLPWETAQSPYLDLSKQLAGSIAVECNTREIPVRALSAALRPLNNMAVPAIGVEIAPPGDKVEAVNDAKYQQNLVSAIASGIIAVRGKLETPAR